MKNSLLKIALLWITIFINCFSQTINWEIIPSGTNQNLNSIYFYNHQVGFACGDSGVIIKTVDSGKTWQSISSPVTVNLNDCNMRAEDCFIIIGDSAYIISTHNGGSNWFINPHFLELYDDLYSVAFSENPQFASSLFVGSSQMLFIGTNINCNGVINDSSTNFSGGFYSAQMLSFELGFIAGEDENSRPIVGRTTDSGSSWDYVSFYLDGNQGRATGVNFTDSLIGYISATVWDGRGAVSKTTDDGDNWTTTFFNHPLNSINFPISGASQVGYCVGDSGTILKTNNAGAVWLNQNSGTLENLNKVFFLDLDFGFAVGDNGIILRTTNGGGPTSVDEEENDQVPTEFLLYQNYPNPFNPTTKIRYSIPQLSNVQIKIFDIIGNEIETLVDEEVSPGNYEATFSSENLSSGIYFYQLVTANYIQTRKMILLK